MSETYRIQYSPESVADLQNIYSYIAFKLLVPETAEQQVNRIRDKIRSLDFMPEKYAICLCTRIFKSRLHFVRS